MALTVEDGTAKVDSDSYLSVADADTIANDILLDASEWTSLSTSEKELYLKRATLLVDLKNNWVSEIKDTDQALAWPRVSFKDKAGRTIEDNIVPQLVKEATLFLAHNESQNGSSFEPSPAVKSESYGDTSVDYAAVDGQSNGEADFFLKLLRSKGYSSGNAVISTYRA